MLAQILGLGAGAWGNSAVASNSIYPLSEEEDRVWTLIMDNKTAGQKTELSPDLQDWSREIKGERDMKEVVVVLGQKVAS